MRRLKAAGGVKVMVRAVPDRNWSKGKVVLPDGEAFRFEMKHFADPSQYGIDEGRISKLYVWTGVMTEGFCYDRGWDVRPRTAAHKAVLAALVEKFN